MATLSCMKRMPRERKNLETPNNDYFACFKDDNLLGFYAYVIGPVGTLYEHKFVKLRFEIPHEYPFVPPICTFIQHTGGRLHPNLYTEGKVCLSILGTWPGEKWAPNMTIDTVLITIRSLLDNSPYKHEPNQKDHPKFNQYVQYTGWTSLLLDYVKNEQDPPARAFLQKHISQHGPNLVNQLRLEETLNVGCKQMTSPYIRHPVAVDYKSLLQNVAKLLDQCNTEAARLASVAPPCLEQGSTDSASQNKLPEVSMTTELLVPTPASVHISTISPEKKSPTKAVKAQRHEATAVPSYHSAKNASPSSQKRKHEVIDLT